MTQARILVVEDDNGLREALVDTLLLGGYECREADSGERALLALSRQPFDMVISDIQMGGMDGLTLLATIRQPQEALARESVSLLLRGMEQPGAHGLLDTELIPGASVRCLL